MALEGELDVKIEEEELEGITTVGAAVDLVMSKVAA
jgi:acyl carrier protein